MSEGNRLFERSDRRQDESELRWGFLHAWINGHFRTLESGELVFYPQGPTGRRGFVVASTEQEMILRLNVQSLRRILGVWMFISVMAASLFLQELRLWQQPLLLLGMWLATWLGARVYFRRFTKQMEPVDVANSPLAYWRSMGTTVSPALLIWQMAFGALLCGFIVYRYAQSGSHFSLVVAMLLVVGLVPYVIALGSWWRLWRGRG